MIFTDYRDGKEYKTVVIGNQTWMAENLNYGSGKCYNDVQDNCAKYGKLYDWKTAMNICPNGWHLPSDKEWTTLESFVGSDVGTKLKSTSNWQCIGGDEISVFFTPKSEWLGLILYTYYPKGACKEPGDGSDEFGFSALPGGGAIPEYYGNPFGYVERNGYWWSSTNNDNWAKFFALIYLSGYIYNQNANKLHLLSVRCVKD